MLCFSILGVISESHGGFLKGLKLTLSFRPYRLLSFSFLFYALGIAVSTVETVLLISTMESLTHRQTQKY